MKLSAALSRLALAASVLLLAGCPKKPNRSGPDDTITMVGPGGNTTPGGNRGGGGGPIFVEREPTTRPGPGIGERVAVDPATAGRGVLASVLFGFDSSAITSAAERAKLQAAAKYLQEHPGDRLVLEGHCDWRGTAEYNLALGDRRALAVRQYLATLNISADRLETVSKGSAGAKEKGATEAEMANDRRVEFVIVPAAPR
jgi:peptidoglycan-associated lipoprotein